MMRRVVVALAVAVAVTIGAMLDWQVLAGTALTMAGLAIALTARQRRRRLEAAPAS